MKRPIIFIMILAFLSSSIGGAQEATALYFDKDAFIASADVKTELKIGMVDCVAMALKNNTEVQIKKITPKIADANVLVQGAKFDPSLNFEWLMEENFELSDRPLFSPNPSKTRTATFNFGYDQQLITGTQLSLALDNLRTRSNANPAIQGFNPSFDSVAEVTVTQPLLKGFGIVVAQADFLIAKNNKLKSVQELTRDIIRVLTEVKKNYYDLMYTREQYRVAKTSLERVENLYYINKEKYAKGLASNVDLLESESEVARMEQAVAAAEGIMENSEDKLKLVTNLVDDPAFWNARITLIDELSYEKTELKLTDEILKAFGHRPDYETAKLDLKNKDISVVYYKNGMLPQMDLVGTYGLNGLGKTIEKDWGHVGGGHYPDWSVGVNFTMPLGSDKERGQYRQSKLEKEQAIIGFKELEHNIILQVRDAVRNVGVTYRMLAASKKSKEAEEKNYEAQETRFRAGLVSTLDIVIYQERLARAQVNYAKSVIDYNTALIELAKAEGMTLINDGITIE